MFFSLLPTLISLDLARPFLFFSVSLSALPFVLPATPVGSLDILPLYIPRIICLLTAYHNRFPIHLPFFINLSSPPLFNSESLQLHLFHFQPTSSPMFFQSALHISNFFLLPQFPVTHLRSVSCSPPPSTTPHKNRYPHPTLCTHSNQRIYH